MTSDSTTPADPGDINAGLLIEPDLPPLLKGRRSLPGISALRAAVDGARSHALGAGDLIWTDDAGKAGFAIVLEPEVPLAKAAQILPVTMAAVGDCIGVLTPPQVGLMYHWPGQVQVNGASAGSVTLASATNNAQEIPDWLVTAVEVTLQFNPDAEEPGHNRERTALIEEGCEGLTAVEFIASCARHFLTWLNVWQDDGYRPVHQNWLERMAGRDAAISIPLTGKRPVIVKGLDEDGGLLYAVGGNDQTRSVPLLSAVHSADALPDLQ